MDNQIIRHKTYADFMNHGWEYAGSLFHRGRKIDVRQECSHQERGMEPRATGLSPSYNPIDQDFYVCFNCHQVLDYWDYHDEPERHND